MDDDRSRRLPTGRLGRFARLAALGARTGANVVLSRDPHAIAERAADVLGTMRGLAAKVGQMASYVDGIVPEAQRGAFEGALSKLRAAAPTSSPDAIVSVIEEDLGAPLDRLFARFDRAPFASASIGQVHRARLLTPEGEPGREVAVKVQHPGIDRAIASDLDNAGVIEGLVGAMGGRKLDSARIYAEIRERFEEELDYRKEAEHQRLFAGIAAEVPGARVPEVIAERSSKRVLTSEFVTGISLDEAAREPEADRARWARTLWELTFRSVLVHGRFNADPHPGNFFFDGEHVVFLDFGCVQPIPEANRAGARAMHRAAIAEDEAAFAAGVRQMLRTKGGTYEKLAIEYTRRCFEPLFRTPFKLTRPYVVEVVEGIQPLKNEAFLGKDGSAVPMPPGMVLMNRLQFGFYSVLARLDVAVDYAAIERPILAALP